MKSFETSVKAHITSSLLTTFDPLQFTYRPNKSTDDAIALALHTALSHLDHRNSDARMLFIDYIDFQSVNHSVASLSYTGIEHVQLPRREGDFNNLLLKCELFQIYTLNTLGLIY